MYLSNSLVELSFSRLSSNKKTGKTQLEKTSALMYFLAFDAVVKKSGKCPLDLNPKKPEGKNNRGLVELEFVRLVLLKGTKIQKVKQVTILGKVDTGGTTPVKRISSNFFTVPLKQASQSVKAFQYPNRPAPVLKMGSVATGMMWGIDYFDNWNRNLPKLLSDLKGNTPFSDLAIFVFRDADFQGRDLRAELLINIGSRFSTDMAAFWTKQINAEKMFFKHADTPFQSSEPSVFLEKGEDKKSAVSSLDLLKVIDTDTLINRVVYLESLLEEHKIGYQSIT